jgi:lipid-A-disaccharide synthase
MFKIRYFTLVNIIPNKEVIQELVGQRFTEENVVSELTRLLSDQPYREQMLADYANIRTILGNTPAAQNAAEIIAAISSPSH